MGYILERMMQQGNRSKYYLERHTPEERREAATSLQWNWSPRALELLTRYPRRREPFSVLAVGEVEELNLKLRQQSGAFAEFQRELGGITYCTYGEEGTWATWGLTELENPERDDEWHGPDFHVCYNSSGGSIEGYCLANDGQLWGVVPEAQHPRIEIERIAAKLEFSALFGRSVARWLSIRDSRIDHPVFRSALASVFNSMGWSVVQEAHDNYSAVWHHFSGWAYYCPAYDSDDLLFFFGAFADLEEILYFKDSLTKLLPDYTIVYE